jgi:hypothetical protein
MIDDIESSYQHIFGEDEMELQNVLFCHCSPYSADGWREISEHLNMCSESS